MKSRLKKNIAIQFVFFVVLLLFASSCSKSGGENKNPLGQDKSQSLFRVVNSDHSNLVFANKVDVSLERNSMFFDYFLNGGGVAVGDINNDDLPDIFFTGNDTENTLYLNEGSLKFKDITKTAIPQSKKWSTGVNMVDINNDDLLDIYICNSGIDQSEGRLANQFLINNGDLTFTDQAEKMGVAGNSLSVQSSFFDYDNDGDLDLWVSNHLNFDGNIKTVFENNELPHDQRKKFRSILYRNEGGMFTDVTEEAGVSRESVSLGVMTVDFNGDNLIDIYISNDYDIPDYYFINNGDGTFTDQSKEKIAHTSFYSMGIDAADINNDGEVDLVAVDMTPQDHVRNKTLMASMDSKKFQYLYDYSGLTRSYMFNSIQIGRGDGVFSEVGNFMGASQTEWSWAPLLADFDNDGYKDLYITNGYFMDTKDNDFKRKVDEYRMNHGRKWNEDVFNYFTSIIKSTPVKNRFFRNVNGKFSDMTTEWSDLDPTFSNGAAYADFDNDGDLDIVINNIARQASLLENTSNGNNYLRLKLKSKDCTHINAEVSIKTDAGVQSIINTHSRGFQSSVEPVVHFGLGNSTNRGEIIVKWNDGKEEIFTEIGTNKVITISKRGGKMFKNLTQKEALLQLDNTLFKDNVVHEEMKYDDFAKEILLPHKYSDLGPALAIADVNNDGVDDIFIGGSNTSESQLIVSKGGQMINQTPIAFKKDKRYEDLGALFFDYDGDGDLDLYVASGGGGEVEQFPELLQDRLYQNDGNGKFSSKTDVIPPITSSTKAIVAIDVDTDGDLDLIIGGRNVPGKYPLAADSYYLENNGTYFRKKSKKLPDDFPGMITDMEATDIDGDGTEDLIVTSEWESPKIYFSENGKFVSFETKELVGHEGWWQSVTSGDFDNDGDVDFVLGNMGENSKFHPSPTKPLGVLASDFDDSGSLDIVLTKKYKDEIVPVRGKECSSQQMPMLKEKFPTYEGFATSSIEDILGQSKIENSYSNAVVDFSSYILINKGNRKFELKRLPNQAQWFPIMDAIINDINSDGHLDVLLIGNKINAEPETPSYDAGRGLILLGDGKSNFTSINNINESGLNINTDARAVKMLQKKGELFYIVASNNAALKVYK